MPEATGLHTARIVSSIAATAISLACGTNYVYSAWGPQFAERLHLTSTEQNLIGTFANLGMYLMGVPTGLLVDRKGPRVAVIIGGLLLGIGYFPLHQAYDKGFASVPVLCMLSFFTGFGGCAAFAASIKVSALNWPQHRGTATAFPLAAFGLSAFFFSMFAQFVFPGSTGHFLLLLSCGTSGLIFVSFFFLRVIPHASDYSAVSGSDSSNRLHRTKSEDSRHRVHQALLPEPGRSDTPGPTQTDEGTPPKYQGVNVEAMEGRSSESSSLLSSSASSIPGDLPVGPIIKDHAHCVDIRGWKILPLVEFWQLFFLLGILTGAGLMTINNIGNDTRALWRHYDDSMTDDQIMKRQAMHVSIISVCSFSGRMLSGIGSDFLVKVLKSSRMWCLTAAAILLLGAQIFAMNIQNPHLLGFVSGFTGIAYGVLFGCFPSLIAEAFGINGLSTNWGIITLSPVISGNIFNLMYGKIYDSHSIINGPHRDCTEGLACYKSAYEVTTCSCLVALVLNLWTIRYTHRLREAEDKQLLRELEDRES
ncbi:major facilitator superfamily domain-containing protein [Calycina marina]|uniref:Major facilitator superfamily domain-containing protein n=1 Tax=Calycina marina TaxID=1763456 RepID=A0A9P8CJW8_9HELO|nr:major facilitator superfamily domain-containing protein [Calycina marina]